MHTVFDWKGKKLRRADVPAEVIEFTGSSNYDVGYITLPVKNVIVDQDTEEDDRRIVDKEEWRDEPWAEVQISSRSYRDPRITQSEDQEYFRSLHKITIKPARDGYKYCTRCDVEQPLTAYSPDSRKRDGRYSECKTCQAERMRRWRKTANPAA